jgi:hypothetical protein
VLTTPVQPDEKIIAQELRAIEAAFARRSCALVREHEKRLAPLREGRLSLPLSALAALATCEAQAQPQARDKQERAVALLTEAQKNLVPAFNFLFLEELKAERLEALGDSRRTLEARRRMREYVASLDALLVKVDGEILRLSGGAEQLSAAQKTRHAEALKLWPNDDRLFDALKIVDDLLGEVVNSEARALLLETRSRILSRIEDDFAHDATLVETRLREGREPEAREAASLMRQRFPRENYTRRIDAILGVPPSPGSAPLGNGLGTDTVAPGGVLLPGAGAAPTDATSASAGGTFGDPSDNGTAGAAVLTSDGAFDAARKSLDAGRPTEALATLSSLPESGQTDKTRRLRREAVDMHVRDTRTQVRNLYNRAGATVDAAQKADILRECKKLLEELLTKYPDSPGRSGIERNLRTINQDLEVIAK